MRSGLEDSGRQGLTMSETLPGILHLHGSANVIAGQEISLCTLLRALERDARQFVLLPGEGRFAERLRSEGFDPILLPLAPLSRRNPFPYLASLIRLALLIHRNRIDLVHASGAYPNQHAAPAARLMGAKAICSVHSTVYRPREFRRNFLSLAHRVVAISEAVRECVRGSISDRKVVMRYSGVDLTRFERSPTGVEVRRELGIPEDALVIGHFSQIIARKRVIDSVRAAAMLKDRYPKLFILIVGEDHHGTGHEREIEDLIRSTGLSDRSLMTGFRADVNRLYPALDLFVFPSEAEGLGLVLLDAMAASRPIVASRIAGTTEVVVDGETGLLYPMGEVDRLAEAIDRLLGDPLERERMGRNGRARVEECFNGDVCAEKLRRSYLELLPRG
jgi:glycosyltransferase involved in cell wall biosynthesis